MIIFGGTPLNVPPLLTLLLAFTAGTQLRAQTTPVRHLDGRLRGFVTIRSTDGKQIGYGSISQFVQGDRITERTTYHFRDGSLDDENVVFSEKNTFALIADHHVQRGPLFSHPLDLTINASGDATNRTIDASGKPKLETSHIDLPPGTAVIGMMSTVLANLNPVAQPLKIPALTPTQKPRLVHFAVAPESHGTFRVSGSRQTASIFRIKTELGGIAGVVAPIIDKQPDDTLVWVLEGDAPLTIRAIGQLSEGGPVMDIQMAGATFPAASAK